jgi:hypothetical protein
MALGGGTFIAQNKILPGSYINFVSAARASATLSDRGIATMPLELDWGPDGEVFAVTSGEFQTESMARFGHAYSDPALKGLRDLFLHIKTGYFYKLNTGGVKASNAFAQAKHTGARGNALTIVIEANEAWVDETNELYDVSTLIDTLKVDVQSVLTASALKPNDYVTFKAGATLTPTAGTPLTGGTNGTVSEGTYQVYLDKIESYSFNTIGCLTSDATVKGLFAAFTQRLRDEVGIKFQCVLHRYTNPDYEGVISVENGLISDTSATDSVYWVTGAEAGCEVNRSNTNARYDGEYDIFTDYTQAELEAGIKAGKFMFHRVYDEVRVLEDINTFVSATDEKSSDFSNNQTIRVLDQIGNDIAALFNSKYLGKVPNDAAGRISLRSDIVKHHEQLQKIRAIEDFTSDGVSVEPGDTKKAVVVTDRVTPVNAMSQLYMVVVVA